MPYSLGRIRSPFHSLQHTLLLAPPVILEPSEAYGHVYEGLSDAER